jgi:Protein of unknown function (DUF2516)
MTGEVFGVDGIFIALVGIVMLIIPIWALVDAIARPSAAFSAARSSKGMWIALIAITWLLTGIIGTVLSVVYLASIRPRVKAITA